MKSNLITILVLAGLVLALSVPVTAETVRANVPFAFQAGGERMDPGEYILQVSFDRHHLTLIRNDNSATKNVPLMASMHAYQIDNGVLVFYKYGNKYFLRSLKTVGPEAGYQFFPSKAEKEMARLYTGREVAMVNAK